MKKNKRHAVCFIKLILYADHQRIYWHNSIDHIANNITKYPKHENKEQWKNLKEEKFIDGKHL